MVSSTSVVSALAFALLTSGARSLYGNATNATSRLITEQFTPAEQKALWDEFLTERLATTESPITYGDNTSGAPSEGETSLRKRVGDASVLRNRTLEVTTYHSYHVFQHGSATRPANVGARKERNKTEGQGNNPKPRLLTDFPARFGPKRK